MPDVIEKNPKIFSGKPVIKGTRIPVRSVVYLAIEKKISPKNIATDYYKALTAELVKEVVKWYEKNKDTYGGLDFRRGYK